MTTQMKTLMMNDLAVVAVATVATVATTVAAAVVKLTINCPLFLQKKTTQKTNS